jgi:hypothetical protein
MDNPDSALLRRALADRIERARTEPLSLRSLDPGALWTDYVVSSRAPLTSPRRKPAGASASASKARPAAVAPRDYRVALRGWAPGESYCSCPDFRTNTLGICKHILFALTRVRRRFPPSVRAVPGRSGASGRPPDGRHVRVHAGARPRPFGSGRGRSKRPGRCFRQGFSKRGQMLNVAPRPLMICP